MQLLIVAVFVLTYIGMAIGRVPGLRLDRTGIALLGLVVLLAAGSIKVEDIGRAVDAPTLLLLFALMIVSAQFGAAGFYDWCAARITAAKFDEPSFEIAMARKDVRLMIEEARRSGVDLFVMPGVAAMFDAAIARGEGALDAAAAARMPL